MGWFSEKVRGHALASGAKEVEKFVRNLETTGDRDLGVILAVATAIRINMETYGVLPRRVFTDGEMPSTEALGLYQMHINKVARQFRRQRKLADSAGAMVWSYSLRCLNVPEFRPFGRRMWGELLRGYPHVEEVLAEGEAQRGEPFSKRVWKEWRMIPVGLEPETPEDTG